MKQIITTRLAVLLGLFVLVSAVTVWLNRGFAGRIETPTAPITASDTKALGGQSTGVIAGQYAIKLNDGFPTTALDSLNAKYSATLGEIIFSNPPDFSANLKLLRAQLVLAPTAVNAVEQAGLQQAIKDAELQVEGQASNLVPGTSLPELGAVYSLTSSNNRDQVAMLEAYRANPAVAYIEPNLQVQAPASVNDPLYNRTGDMRDVPTWPDMWGMKKIDSEGGWALMSGNKVTVAVVDSGVDYLHEDIASNMWVNPLEDLNHNGRLDYWPVTELRNWVKGDLDGVDNDKNGYIDDVNGYNFMSNNANTMDDLGHGTHTSGTIGAVGNNGIGMLGVAYSSSKIMALRIFGAAGEGPSIGFAKAIKYAADNGAKVISNSWMTPYSALLEDAVNYATAKGAVVVAATGNSSEDLTAYSPANLKNVIAVGASDNNDKVPSFSNYGSGLGVVAPGVWITSLRASAVNGRTPTGFPNNLIYDGGTSMATPMVAAEAAVIMSKNPGYSPSQVSWIIRNSAEDILTPGWDLTSGYGRINLAKAMRVSNVPAKELQAKISTPKGGSAVTGVVAVSGLATGSKYSLVYLKEGEPTEYPIAAGTLVNNGPLGSWNTTTILRDGKYILRLKATDGNGLSQIDQTLVTVSNQYQKIANYQSNDIF